MRSPVTLNLALATVLALTACGKSASGGASADGQAADPAKAAAQMAFQFQPGQYRSAVTINKVEMPGMPAGAADHMKTAMGKVGMVEYCISPEQAAKGMEAMKEHLAEGKCHWEKFAANGGSVDAVMACEGPNGGSIRTASHGTYTPTGAIMQASADMMGPGGRGMHIEETVKMERIGDCTK